MHQCLHDISGVPISGLLCHSIQRSTGSEGEWHKKENAAVVLFSVVIEDGELIVFGGSRK
jgi:hypothetical protein